MPMQACTGYHFRFDDRPGPEGYDGPDLRSRIKGLLSKYGNLRSLCVRETSGDPLGDENPHFHLFCVFPSIHKIGTIRKYVLRKVLLPDQSGNGSYSMKKITPRGDANSCYEEMEVYLCKGADRHHGPAVERPLTTATYTPDVIARLHDKYWQTNDTMREKKRKSTMFEQLQERVKRLATTVSERPSREAIAGECVDLFGENHKPMSIHSMTSLTNLVWYHTDPEATRSMLIDEILGRRF